MSRLSFTSIPCYLVFALSLSSAQPVSPAAHIGSQSGVTQDSTSQVKPANTQTQNNDKSGITMRAPEQLRRITPPSPAVPAKELEQAADSLRVQTLYADAVDYYRAALPRTSNPDSIYNKMGIAELLMLRLGDAKKSFERAIKANRSNAEAYNNLGVVHYEERNFRRAIKYYNKAIELS